MALVDERDAHHRRASKDLVAAAGRGLVVTSSVLTECSFLLAERYARKRLRMLLDRLDIRPIEPQEPWWPDVFSWMDRCHQHQPDFADAQLCVLSSRDPKIIIWTYDREFRSIWRRLDGSAIPLLGQPSVTRRPGR